MEVPTRSLSTHSHRLTHTHTHTHARTHTHTYTHAHAHTHTRTHTHTHMHMHTHTHTHLVSSIGHQHGKEVEEEVTIGTNSVSGRVFPSLKTTAIQQVVSLQIKGQSADQSCSHHPLGNHQELIIAMTMRAKPRIRC